MNHNRQAGNLTQQLVQYFSSLIDKGTVAPGEKLPPESEIVRQRKVSRTVVREAISKLQAAGLVETRHGIGTFVLAPGEQRNLGIEAAVSTIRDVVAMLELRIGLETEAAGLAAARRTEAHLAAMRLSLESFHDHLARGDDTVQPDFEFHLGIARATGNQYFHEILSHLGASVIPRSRAPIHEAQKKDPGYINRIDHEHEDIYNAIQRSDPEGARAAIRNHLVNSRERLRRAYTPAESGMGVEGTSAK